MRAGSDALLLQAYRHYNPGNIWLIQHEDATTEEEQKHLWLSEHTFFRNEGLNCRINGCFFRIRNIFSTGDMVFKDIFH